LLFHRLEKLYVAACPERAWLGVFRFLVALNREQRGGHSSLTFDPPPTAAPAALAGAGLACGGIDLVGSGINIVRINRF
jgi:hypothetical protein